MSCSERLQYSGFGWMFYVSKWQPGLEIGNSFNIDKYRFLSTMTSFVHGRKGPRSFLLIHPWVNPEPPKVASWYRKGSVTYSWFAWALRDPCPAFWTMCMFASQGGVLCVQAQEATHSLVPPSHPDSPPSPALYLTWLICPSLFTFSLTHLFFLVLLSLF